MKPFIETWPLEWNRPVIFASPHSGRCYSPEFLCQTRLNETTLRSTEDAFLDILYREVPTFGAPLICVTVPRAYIDLNRAPDDLDPAIISGLHGHGMGRRSQAGYGVIPRLVGKGQAIYSDKMTFHEAQCRITAIHMPYHERLDQLMDKAVDRFGEVILIDCHSTPHDMLASASPTMAGRWPDVVLGDRYGRACGVDITEQARTIFDSMGLSVTINEPFAGAYISHRHGRPQNGRHVLQIELDRRLYLDEATIKMNANFVKFRSILNLIIARLVAIRSRNVPVAAE